MNQNFVYLIVSENRLVILQRVITTNKDYKMLMNVSGPTSLDFCKLYCLGFLYGSQYGGNQVVNSPVEFQ